MSRWLHRRHRPLARPRSTSTRHRGSLAPTPVMSGSPNSGTVSPPSLRSPEPSGPQGRGRPVRTPVPTATTPHPARVPLMTGPCMPLPTCFFTHIPPVSHQWQDPAGGLGDGAGLDPALGTAGGGHCLHAHGASLHALLSSPGPAPAPRADKKRWQGVGRGVFGGGGGGGRGEMTGLGPKPRLMVSTVVATMSTAWTFNTGSIA